MFDAVQPVSLSPRAAIEIRKIMETKNIPAGYGLRVGVRGGHGCGGVTLIIGFDTQKPSDLSYAVDGLSVLVDKKHMLYLMGKEVDYYEGSDAKGFLFVDPQSRETAS